MENNSPSFKIYLPNGETYVGAVETAPTRGIQIIVQPNPNVGWVTTHSSDYYMWRNNMWFGGDIFGLWDYLASDGWKKVLFGLTLTNEEFAEVFQRAKADRMFALKTGYLPRERKAAI